MQKNLFFIHPDGKNFIFCIQRTCWTLVERIFFASRMDHNGNWSKPENLGYPINTFYNENSLMVSAEGDIAFLLQIDTVDMEV